MWNKLKPKIRLNTDIFCPWLLFWNWPFWAKLRWFQPFSWMWNIRKFTLIFPEILNSKLEWEISKIIFIVHSRISYISKNILGFNLSYDFCPKWPKLDSRNSSSPKIRIVSEVKVPQLVQAFEYGWDEAYMNNERFRMQIHPFHPS